MVLPKIRHSIHVYRSILTPEIECNGYFGKIRRLEAAILKTTVLAPGRGQMGFWCGTKNGLTCGPRPEIGRFFFVNRLKFYVLYFSNGWFGIILPIK